jgi:DNA-binding response OmpR family regulator
MRILIVAGDPTEGGPLARRLLDARFEVDLARTGDAGVRAALQRPYGAIIVDTTLPGLDGWTLCRTLRERRESTPILMISARGSVDDRVRGFEAGADDFLAKPFDFRELLARVRALLRRDRLHKAAVIRIADLEVDTLSRCVRRGGAPIHLTPREYALLEALASYEGQVLTREMVLERVWQDDTTLDANVNVHLSNLRRKVDGGHPVKLIHTVRGVGYTLREPALEPRRGFLTETGGCGAEERPHR